MNALDIVRKTPRTNCGECGYPACMAFAVAVVSAGADPAACPYMEPEAVQADTGEIQHVQDPDTVLLKTLKEKVRAIDLAERAERLGGVVIDQGGNRMLRLEYLGQPIMISSDSIYASDGRELDPRDQILLYNYLFFGGEGQLSGEWVGLESFPNSISKVTTLRRYTEDKLAHTFEVRGEQLSNIFRGMGAVAVKECHADFCAVVPILPKVPVQVHFWDRDEEDDFPASVKVLFDRNALEFLDIESLIFASERMAEKACEML